jgi:hypothetical protein
MRRPVILLAFGVAILGTHTRLANLEASAPLLTALGAALGRCIFMIIHDDVKWNNLHKYLCSKWAVKHGLWVSLIKMIPHTKIEFELIQQVLCSFGPFFARSRSLGFSPHR